MYYDWRHTGWARLGSTKGANPHKALRDMAGNWVSSMAPGAPGPRQLGGELDLGQRCTGGSATGKGKALGAMRIVKDKMQIVD